MPRLRCDTVFVADIVCLTVLEAVAIRRLQSSGRCPRLQPWTIFYNWPSLLPDPKHVKQF